MYNFDEIIDRRHTNAMNTDGFRDYIFHADETMKFPYQDEEFIRMWVADMEFATPDLSSTELKRDWKSVFSVTQEFLRRAIMTHSRHGARANTTGHSTAKNW